MEKLKILFRPLKYLDIYGVPIRVNFKNEEIHKTSFGALMSFAVFIITGLAVYFYGQELFNRNNPIVITSEQYVKNPQRMDIDKTQQIIVMGFNNSTGQTVYEPSVIQVSASISKLKKIYNETTQGYQNSLQSTSLIIRPCNRQDIRVGEINSYFDSLPLSNYFCFDDNQEVYIEGDYSGDVYSKVDVFFSQCKNSTQPGSVVCKPQEQIDKVTSNLFFLAYMLDKIVDPTNLDNPFSYQGINLETQTSAQQSQQYTAFFENYYIQSDTGLITQQVNEKRDFLYVQSRSDNLYGKPGLLIQFTLRPYKNKQLFMQRRYMKFSDLIAQLGGIIKLLTLIGFAVTYPFARLHLNKEIINSIFDFNFTLSEKKLQIEDDNQTEKDQAAEIEFNKQKKLQTEFNRQFKLMQNQQDLDSKLNEEDQNQCNNSEVNQRSKKQQASKKLFDQEKPTEQQQLAILSPNNKDSQLLKKENLKILQINNSVETDLSNNKIIKRSYESNFKKREPFKNLRESDYTQEDRNESQHIRRETQQIQENSQIVKSLMDSIKIILNPLKAIIKLTIIEYIKYFSSSNSKQLKQKKEFIQNGFKKVSNHLDIENILNKLQELEKLKQVVLNEDQLKLFELLPRPVLRSDSSESQSNQGNSFYDKINKTYEEKVDDAFQSLANILNKPKKSQRDIQLIQLLDKKIYSNILDAGLLAQNADKYSQNNQTNNLENSVNNQNYVQENIPIQRSPSCFVGKKFFRKDSQFKEELEKNQITQYDVTEGSQTKIDDVYFNFKNKIIKNSMNL
ncbi:zinc knuckle protein (macronuclear) [Tetrahymena thermophila SB210]|uniref:Zinc knuckle protein n=1 Tax=Tetrahymena thermophila (strain SB210) TaxID=312017 RepID=I7LVD1_TETTS|nr:zinc knuckle protein [Tetrahymena thermophila SB210]EAR97898.2 zinc knuckle protein [Tetrahymena thermophila SB210]|eukprot:XP_001018143.2 zinc knuckle protein [Tetrahymena thermophila SB210]